MNEDAQEHKNLILQEFGVASQWNSKTETSETNNNAVLLLLLVWVVRFVLGPYYVQNHDYSTVSSTPVQL